MDFMRSIRFCALCGRNGSVDPLDKHHVFGGANRAKSEKYGATVDLCHERCHERGPEAVHNCRETDLKLKRKTQRELMERLGWSEDDFRREFGKSWL